MDNGNNLPFGMIIDDSGIVDLDSTVGFYIKGVTQIKDSTILDLVPLQQQRTIEYLEVVTQNYSAECAISTLIMKKAEGKTVSDKQYNNARTNLSRTESTLEGFLSKLDIDLQGVTATIRVSAPTMPGETYVPHQVVFSYQVPFPEVQILND